MNSENILQPIDVNTPTSPLRKRARYESPNNHPLSQWSLKGDLVLDEVYDYGVGRLDCESEVASEDDGIFKSGKGEYIDVSCHSMSPDTRQKQIAILESTLSRESLQKLSNGEWTNSVKNVNFGNEIKKNNFDLLSDEVMLHIFSWISKRHYSNLALVCKRFNRLLEDESLWTKLDVADKKLEVGQLGKLLSLQVVILRLARSQIMHPPILPYQSSYLSTFRSRLLYLDLSMASISEKSLTMLFSRCDRLKKVSLENVPVDNEVLAALSGNKSLEIINLAMATGIREEGLRYLLTNCRKIRELNIAWTGISSETIKYLCKNLPSSLDRINLSGCKTLISDGDVASLVSCCPSLRELDLSDCTALTAEAVRQITALEDLNFLALSRCYSISYRALLQLKKMSSLAYLDIHGGYIDSSELNVVQKGIGNHVYINQYMFSSVARPTVGPKSSRIWNIRVRD